MFTEDASDILKARLEWNKAKVTTSRVMSIHTTLEIYYVDNEKYPAPGDYEALKNTLVPSITKSFPREDAWGSPFQIQIAKDRQSYVIVSAGSDLKFHPESWSKNGKFTDTSEDLVLTGRKGNPINNFVRSWVEQKTATMQTLNAYLDDYMKGEPESKYDTEKQHLINFLIIVESVPRSGSELCSEISNHVESEIARNPSNARAYFLRSIMTDGCMKQENRIQEDLQKAAALHPAFEQARKEIAEQQKRGRARKTMSDMRAIGAALEAYAVDNNQYPVVLSGEIKSLVSVVQPTYIRALPLSDAWGGAFRYYCLKPEGPYWVIAYGQDVEPQKGLYKMDGSPSVEVPAENNSLDDDLIFSEGKFIRYAPGTE